MDLCWLYFCLQLAASCPLAADTIAERAQSQHVPFHLLFHHPAHQVQIALRGRQAGVPRGTLDDDQIGVLGRLSLCLLGKDVMIWHDVFCIAHHGEQIPAQASQRCQQPCNGKL
jgi:hypothetical protein